MNENVWLVNEYCNLVNKTIYFIQNYFEGVIPAGHLDEDLYWKTKNVYQQERAILQSGSKEELVALLEEYLQFANEYFEKGNLWGAGKEDRRVCRNTILNSVQLIANLTILLSPIAEYPTAQVSRWLELQPDWQVQRVHSGYELPRTETIGLESGQIGA